MIHSFDIEDAKKYGVDCAVLVYNIKFWLAKNYANKTNIHDGYVWTYNSASAFAELFPYWTQNKIQKTLKKMEDDGILITGNYNKIGYDRKKWYTLPEFSIQPNGLMDAANPPTGLSGKAEPIADSKPDKKPSIKDLFDAKRIIPVWNSLGCARHKGLTKSAEKALEKTYKEYCKSAKEPKELNDWLESYLKKGFKNWMTDHHRDLDNGQWCADLEFAVRFSTYDKIKNTVKK